MYNDTPTVMNISHAVQNIPHGTQDIPQGIQGISMVLKIAPPPPGTETPSTALNTHYTWSSDQNVFQSWVWGKEEH